MWGHNNFALVAGFIIKKFDMPVLIAGSNKEAYIAKKIKKRVGRDRIFDITGKTTLPELVKIISEAELLISNDTCAVHIGAAVNTETICISNGSLMERFTEYPPDIYDKIHTIYPDKIADRKKSPLCLEVKHWINPGEYINRISADAVKKEAEKILQ